MSGELLALLTSYGLPALFAILLATSAGAPFPDSLLLVAVGSFVAQGDLDFTSVAIVGTLGAVAGDQLGYAIGYWGGRPLAARIVSADKIAKAEAFSRRWGAAGIFFSRWLVGPLGPWIDITSGMTAYPWTRFFLLDALGELVWVVLYVSLGRVFSDKVQAIADLLGNLTWVAVGLLAACILKWKLWTSRSSMDDARLKLSPKRL